MGAASVRQRRSSETVRSSGTNTAPPQLGTAYRPLASRLSIELDQMAAKDRGRSWDHHGLFE